MKRRDFFKAIAGTAGGLVLPYEPKRIYSFGGHAMAAAHAGYPLGQNTWAAPRLRWAMGPGDPAADILRAGIEIRTR